MNRKVLVIKPPYLTIPVSFAYVLASLEEHGIPFDFLDTARAGRDCRKLVRSNDYLAVATGGLVGDHRFFAETVRQVRDANPGTPVILGGNVTKDLRADFLYDKIGIDYGILGESETSFPFLLKGLDRKEDLSTLPGLVYRDQQTGEIRKNRAARLDLESKNRFPAWHHVDIEFYAGNVSMPFWGDRRAMPVLSGRGCVGHCAFCSPTIGTFHKRPVSHVIEEIRFLNSRYEFDWIVFWNEMFYDSREEILEFCESYRGIHPKKPWVCALRTDVDIDRDTFLAMRDAGCLSVSAGIESGSDKVFRHMRKNTTKAKTIRFFRAAREAGMPSNGTFLMAHEGESENDLIETIDMIIAEEMNTVESLTSAYPGTLLYRHALKRGMIRDEWEFISQYRFGCGIWEVDWVNRNYLNLSDIPDHRLWDVLVREARRFHTFQLRRYPAKDVRMKSLPWMSRIRVDGVCAECGEPVGAYFPVRLLGLETNCPKCFQVVVFNLYDSGPFRPHFHRVASSVRIARRILVLGVNEDAGYFLRSDVFGLDYERIAGFLDPRDPGGESPRFLHAPRYRLGTAARLAPDLVLILDEMGYRAEVVLRRLFAAAGIPPPDIVHLEPYSRHWQLRLIDRFNRMRLESRSRIFYVEGLRFVSLILHAHALLHAFAQKTRNFLIGRISPRNKVVIEKAIRSIVGRWIGNRS